jgi:hypothetical protein
MLNLEYLVSNSDETILKEYSYSGGILTINLELTEIDKKVMLKIKSSHLSFDSFYLEKKEELYRTCRIEIQDLSEILSTQNGIYVPSNVFGILMNESRSNYNLAYGKKSSELKYVFSLIGYGKLVSCLISDLNSIEIY